MSNIKSIKALEILDSRGNPTVEVALELTGGAKASAGVPSGASSGKFEACELRDGGTRYGGLGVTKAVSNVNCVIAKAVCGKDLDQNALDHLLIELDGTSNKSNLGANAMLGVSMAFAKAVALERGVELFEYFKTFSPDGLTLPTPMFNIINGGKHADSGLDVQEFMIAPVGLNSFEEKLRAGSEIVASLRKILKSRGLSTAVGDEGGFAPRLSSNEEAIDLIIEAIESAGYSTSQIKIALDVASSTLFDNGSYKLKSGGERNLTSSEMIDWLEGLSNKYPIISIEDGLSEEDWEGFSNLNKRLGDKVMIVGDDLTVTNTLRIKKAKDLSAINAVLIKPNQIGTITETIEAVLLTKSSGMKPFVSHRSGETNDSLIADLSVGLGVPFIKSGAPVRGERLAKYNRLLSISNILN